MNSLELLIRRFADDLAEYLTWLGYRRPRFVRAALGDGTDE